MLSYYSPEYVAQMFDQPLKVCALCDANFPIVRQVKVESVDGKKVSGTYMTMSDKAYTQIMKAINSDE